MLPSTLATLTGLPAPTSIPLSCTSGSTVLHTTDCTYGFPISYCYSAPPPVTCSPSSYPVVGHNRCNAFTFCAKVPATTSSCSQQDGFTATSTATLYSGTLAGETTATVIKTPACGCAGYYGYETHVAGVSTSYRSVCLPLYGTQQGGTTTYSGAPTAGTCAPYFTSSTSRFTLTDGGITQTNAFTHCFCPSGSTASYTDLGNATPTCVAITAQATA
jgi:hypothetical protein